MDGKTGAWLLLKSLLFTVLMPCSVAVWMPLAWFSPDRGVLGLGAGHFAGLPLMAFGAAIYLRCLLDFTRALGTPAPLDPPKELVVTGLYRFVRNPMYCGVLAALLGLALFLESGRLLVYGFAVFTGFSLFVLLYEEPALASRFGESYDRYKAAVPRWIPRLRPWDGGKIDP